MGKIFKNVLLLIISLISLTGCSMSLEEERGDLMKEKTITELQFVEDAIFNITNKYAKGEYETDDGLDWNSILEDEKKINEVLETIILDLSEMNISQENLILFSNELNNLLTVTLEENEDELLLRAQKLYALVPRFLNEFSDDKNEVKDKELQDIVLSSLAFANVDEWDEAKSTIQSAIDKYNEMMNDVDYMQSRSYSLNRVYVLLGEVKNAIDLENLALVNLKVVNFIEKM